MFRMTHSIRPSRPRGQAGFGAVEAMAAITVLALATAVALPNAKRLLETRRLDNSVALIASKLAETRMNAIKRNRSAWLRVDPESRTFQIQTTNDDGDVIDLGVAERLNQGIVFSMAETALITFNSLGRLTTAGETIRIETGQPDDVVSVNVSALGKISVSH